MTGAVDPTGPISLDPELNRLPSACRHIHVMGVCGTGMGALAGMLREAGYRVTGSDANVYPPMSDFLAASGIPVADGYRAENLLPRPDLVIVGNVITARNPEAHGLAAAAIPYLSMPQVLNRIFIDDRTSLVVTGTHGKTTTSSLLATMLAGAGLSPGFMIGGLVKAFGRNYNIGSGPFFVTEGDEYDTAFFDKGPKFLHYKPDIAILTSIEFDHADIYSDLEAIKASFRRLVAIMPPDGLLVACYDDPVVCEVVAGAPCRVVSYGESEGLDWQMKNPDVTPSGTLFSVRGKGRDLGVFTSMMPGRHNGLNSLAVIAVLDHIGMDRDVIAAQLEQFQGVRRRQEVRGAVRDITVIDDFAHHPTAVRETLAALRSAYAGKRLVAVFEPRTNTSRRNVFQQRYVEVFDHADVVVVKAQETLANISEEERFSCRRLVDDLCERGVDSHYFVTTDAILDYLQRQSCPGDVIAILSNGGFDNIHARLLDLLAGSEAGSD